MKNLVVFWILLLIPICFFGFETREISLSEIEAIALRNAEAQWGKVYADAPIPYYDREGKLAAWQFNFRLGEPFPDPELLRSQCRNSGEKLWGASWNSDSYANMLLGARSDRPVIISYAKGLSYDYSYLATAEKIAARELGLDFKLEHMVNVNSGSKWFVVSDASKELYIKAFAPAKALLREDFLAATDKLQTPLIPMDFSSEWDEYLAGRTDTRAYEYIPNHQKMPFYAWHMGCSPTSATMLAAWWDTNSDVTDQNFANLVKIHHERWDSYQEQLDFHVPDANRAIAGYMGTDDEGSTSESDIDDGILDFFESRGYDCWTDNDDIEWEFLWDYDDLFYAARGQIRAGRPLITDIPGHTIVGMGYSTTSHHIANHDPNHSDIQNLYQSEFDMLCYVLPSGGYGKAVNLISPDGGQDWWWNGTGETWYASDFYEIRWEGDFSADTYAKISYHLDGGLEDAGWNVITANTPNDGSYDWLIPSALLSDQCRVKVDIFNSANQLLGSDGSWGNFTILTCQGCTPLVDGIPKIQSRNPVYYSVPDTGNSWAAIANYKNNTSSGMALTLYDSPSFGSVLSTSANSSGINLIALDRNHLPNNTYGLKVQNLDGMVGGSTEFEGGDHELNPGSNSGFTWSLNQVVRMWDVELTPGAYVFRLDIDSGDHNLGMAFFVSQGGSYIRPINQALVNVDAYPSGGSETFTVFITNTDRYGLCVYNKDPLILTQPSTYSIFIGSPGYWSGAVSQIWNNPANWGNGQVPTSSSNVLIPSGVSFMPRIAAGVSAHCRSLTIAAGASLEVANGTLNVHAGYTDIYGTLSIGNSAAVLTLGGHVQWHSGSLFQETAGGSIWVNGDWVAELGSNVEISSSSVIMAGGESTVIQIESSSHRFGDLRIAKTDGRRVSYSMQSTTAMFVQGDMQIDSGAEFSGWSPLPIHVEGDLLSNGSLVVENSMFIFDGGSPQTISLASGNYFHDFYVSNNSEVQLLSSISVQGDVSIINGTLNAGSNSIYVQGNWETNLILGHLSGPTNRVIFQGETDSSCSGLDFNILELNKSGSAELVIGDGKIVQCAKFNWTSGVIRVAGGDFWASDLMDVGVYGNYILADGQIDLTAATLGNIDIEANLSISGGLFNIHGGTLPSRWARLNSCQITMSGGILDFLDQGVRIQSTSHYLINNISGGTIRCRGDFLVERNGFNPLGGALEMYGSGPALLQVSSPSTLSSLIVNKGGRDGQIGQSQQRIDQVSVTNTQINGSVTVQSGLLNVNGSLIVNGSLNIHDKVKMDLESELIDVQGAVIWHTGSSAAYLTAGSIKHRSYLNFNQGCSVGLSPDVKLIFSMPGTSVQSITIYEPGVVMGTVINERLSGKLRFTRPEFDPIHIAGDLITKANATTELLLDNIYIGGKIDIYNLGTLTLKNNIDVFATNLYNSGLLNLPSDFQGRLQISNTFLQYASGSLALHGGSLILNKAYSGAQYSFGGSTTMSGGILQITNNGMQLGSSGFSFTGGTIKLGWSFTASSPDSFMANAGTLEMIGSLSSNLSLGSGNYLPNLVINKTEATGAVHLISDVSVKGVITLSTGKLKINHHRLTAQADLIIAATGYLYCDNADDEIWVKGDWINNGAEGNFLEGSGTVVFYGSWGHIQSPESFHNLRVHCDYPVPGTGGVYINSALTVNVLGDLDITAGSLNMWESSTLTVSGNVTVTGEEFSVFSNPQIPVSTLTIGGDLSLGSSILDLRYANLLLHGNLSTTSGSSIVVSYSAFINDAPFDSGWQLINCSWNIGRDSVVEFTHKSVQMLSGNQMNLSGDYGLGTLRTGRSFYAVQNGATDHLNYGTIEFIGSEPGSITLGGDNSLPGIKINKSGATITLTDATVINGDLSITSGVFNSNGMPVELHGNWENNVGTSGYSSGNSVITLISRFSGSAQNIYGAQSFYKVLLNHPSNLHFSQITLGGPVTILNNLEILGGGLCLLYSFSTLQVDGNLIIAEGAYLKIDQLAKLYLRGNLTDNNPVVGETDLQKLGFFCVPSGELELNGSSNQTLSVASDSIELGKLRVNKSGGTFLPAKPMIISGEAILHDGAWHYAQSGLTHRFLKGFSISSGASFTDNSGSLLFEGDQDGILTNNGTASFKNILINKTATRTTGATVSLGSNITMNTVGTITVGSGTLDLGAWTLQTKGDLYVHADARLAIGAGGRLEMINGSTLSVYEGGTLESIGTLASPATITRINDLNAYYHLHIQSGATLASEYTTFEYMGPDGVNIASGATIDPEHPLYHCSFRYGYSSGTLLTINNDQTITIDHAYMPSGATAFYNVSKPNDQGSVHFSNETGGWVGSLHENDPWSRINWSADVPQILANPPIFSFGDVVWSQTSAGQGLNISNGGSAMLSGTMIIPDGFSVVPMREPTASSLGSAAMDKGPEFPLRGILDFSVEIGGSQNYWVYFQPSEPIPYNGTLVINHNAPSPSVQISLSGEGVGPRIEADHVFYNVDLYPGQTGTRDLLISNTGVDSLSLMAYVSYPPSQESQIIATGFEGSFPPSGWTVTQVDYQSGSTAAQWNSATATVHPSGQPPHEGSQLAYLNSYWAYSGNSARLESPAFDLTNINGATLSFWMYHDPGYSSNNDRIQVQVSVDNGLNWTNLGTPILRYDATSQWTQHILGLWEQQGFSNVRVGLLGISGYGNDLHVDDLSVTGSFSLPMDWIQLNSDNLVWTDVDAGSSLPIEISIDSDGIPAGWYYNTINISSNDPQNFWLTIPLNVRIGTPAYEVSPSYLSFGNLPLQSTAYQDFDIVNTGAIGLTGTVSAPEGYSVEMISGPRQAELPLLSTRRDASSNRNTVEFYAYPGIVANFRLHFSPSQAIDYSDQLTISTNTGSPSYLPVYGGGISLPVVSTLPVTDIEVQAAIAHGQLNDAGNLPILERGICWNTYGDPTLEDNQITDSGTDSIYDIPMPNLLHMQTYYIKAYATNTLGTAYGEETSFTTLSPWLITSPSTLPDFGLVPVGTQSAPQFFTISGGNLVDFVMISSPGNFRLSLAPDSGYDSILIINPENYLLPETNVYVKFIPQWQGPCEENLVPLTVGGGGCDVSLSGTGVTTPEVETATIVDITSGGATVNARILDDGLAPILSCGVCYGTASGPTLAGPHTDEGPQSGWFSSDIADLEPNTQYHVRSYAQNLAGLVYGNEVSFYSTPVPEISVDSSGLDPFGKIVVGQISAIQTISVSAQQLVEDLLITAPAGFQITLDPLDRVFAAQITIAPVTGMIPETTLYLRFAPDAGGNLSDFLLFSSLGLPDVQTLLLGIGVTLATVSTLSVTDITSESAVCSAELVLSGWDEPSARGICYSTDPAPDLEDPHTVIISTEALFSSLLDSLLPDTQYYARAYATNLAGTAYGEELSFNTLLGFLDAPQNLLISLQAEGLMLQWDSVAGANSYRIYRCSDPYALDWGLPVAVTVNSTWIDSSPVASGFYRVIASSEEVE